ncbi:hypothetical protein PAHAL_2G262200 [Panicum hallii]|uniref:Uncharacterized protein n=1 Tax=Panicum hallii TaxID=206008 RepID=A0A2S3GZG3_9POAL|nr:hypothetical protein PAHAL_2G262200 [Panicum hallii]
MSLTNSLKSILPSLSSSYASIMLWHSAAPAGPNPSDPSTVRSSAASMNPSPSRSKTANAARASSTVASSSSNSAAASSNPTDTAAPPAPITPSTTSMAMVAGLAGAGDGDGGAAAAAGVGAGAASRRRDEEEDEVADLMTAVRKTRTALMESVSTACAREMLWEDVVGADAEAMSMAAVASPRISPAVISAPLIPPLAARCLRPSVALPLRRLVFWRLMV